MPRLRFGVHFKHLPGSLHHVVVGIRRLAPAILLSRRRRIRPDFRENFRNLLGLGLDDGYKTLLAQTFSANWAPFELCSLGVRESPEPPGGRMTNERFENKQKEKQSDP